MSEKLSIEQAGEHHLPLSELLTNKEHLITEKRPDIMPKENIDTVRKKIENVALPGENLKFKETENPTHHHYLTAKIKQEYYEQTIQDIRPYLSNSQKSLSKIVHNHVVENISELGAKTIARPVCLFTAATVTLLSSVLIILIARKVGFGLPNSIFILLFMIGYVLGLVVEIIIKLFGRNHAE